MSQNNSWANVVFFIISNVIKIRLLLISLCLIWWIRRPSQGGGGGYLFPCSPEINWLVPLFPKNRKFVFLCSLFPNIVFIPLFLSYLAFVPLSPWNKCPFSPVPQNPWEGLNKKIIIIERSNCHLWIQRGGQGVRTTPEKSQKYRVSEKNWSGSLGKSQSYQASIQYWAIIGPSGKLHLNGVSLVPI